MCIYKRVSINREEQISPIMRNNFFSVTCNSYIFIHTRVKWTQETKCHFQRNIQNFLELLKFHTFKQRGGLSLPLPRLFVTLNNLYLLVLIYCTAKFKASCIREAKLLGQLSADSIPKSYSKRTILNFRHEWPHRQIFQPYSIRYLTISGRWYGNWGNFFSVFGILYTSRRRKSVIS